MIGPLIGLVGIGLILLVSEILWRKKQLSPEVSRKFVHIFSGTFIAFWPFIMTFHDIQILSALLLAVVAASKSLRFFMSIHGVGRQTYGEVLFPVGIFLAATFANTEWIYSAVVLHLSLADGFAALIGSRHGKRFGYKIFGQTKTVIGTAVFYVFSLFIVAGAMMLDPAYYGNNAVPILIFLPIAATIIENIAMDGTDNLFVPLIVLGVLNNFQL